MTPSLHLLPVSLGESAVSIWMPPEAQKIAQILTVYIVENAKTARAFLKTIETQHPLPSVIMYTIEPHTSEEEIKSWLLAHDTPIGLVSEAGCPAIADPGARVVAYAHKLGIRINPWVGPSSIVLGLMASGLNGQKFCFHGYPPSDSILRTQTLQKWEQSSQIEHCTQICIETPYRNQALLQACLDTLHHDTRLCIARSLTTPDELIKTASIKEWKSLPLPDLHKQPTLFLFLALGSDSKGKKTSSPGKAQPSYKKRVR